MDFHLFHFINKNNEVCNRNAIERLKYIENEKEKIVYRQNRLPQWANNDPFIFFEASVKNSPCKVHTYRELEMSSLNLGISDLKEYLQLVVNAILPDKYYAIIVKKGPNIDSPLLCHILFNDGMIDKYELAKERPMEQFFCLYRSRNPEKGGARKDFYNILYTEGEAVREYRKIFVDTTNYFCKKKGFNYKFLCGLYVNSYDDLIYMLN